MLNAGLQVHEEGTMRQRAQLWAGVGLVTLGLLLLVARLLHIDLGQLCCPTALILLGGWFLFRPYWTQAELGVRVFGDLKRRQPWTVRNEELWVLIGDTELDFTRAEIPEGETVIRLLGLIHDVDVRLPVDAALRITSTALVTELEAQGHKEDNVFVPVDRVWGDGNATKRVYLQCVGLVVDLTVD